MGCGMDDRRRRARTYPFIPPARDIPDQSEIRGLGS